MNLVRCLALLAALIAFPLLAAEPEGDGGDNGSTAQAPAASEATSQDTGGDTTAPETDNADLTQPPPDQDFVPSVRITEDLPVAFPVDI